MLCLFHHVIACQYFRHQHRSLCVAQPRAIAVGVVYRHIEVFVSALIVAFVKEHRRQFAQRVLLAYAPRLVGDGAQQQVLLLAPHVALAPIEERQLAGLNAVTAVAGLQCRQVLEQHLYGGVDVALVSPVIGKHRNIVVRTPVGIGNKQPPVVLHVLMVVVVERSPAGKFRLEEVEFVELLVITNQHIALKAACVNGRQSLLGLAEEPCHGQDVGHRQPAAGGATGRPSFRQGRCSA